MPGTHFCDEPNFLIPLYTRAGLDTDSADMLADKPHFPEFFELLKTCPVVKLFFFLFYSLSRTGLKALHACTAITLQRLIRFKRHVGQHRDQPEPCPEFRVDKKVAPSYKAQTSQIAYFLMERCALCFSQSIIWEAGMGRAWKPDSCI